MIVRHKPAESGTCHADLCGEIVVEGRAIPDEDGETEQPVTRAFCAAHARERDLELSVRNAAGRTADVLQLSDWERDADGRARRREE